MEDKSYDLGVVRRGLDMLDRRGRLLAAYLDKLGIQPKTFPPDPGPSRGRRSRSVKPRPFLTPAAQPDGQRAEV